MNSRQKQIQEALDMRTAKGNEVHSGVVKSVDEAKGTMEVWPDDGDKGFFFPVMLRSSVKDLKGIVMIPKVGSEVTYASIGGANEFTIVNASELDKVLIDVGKISISCNDIVINNGDNHGMALVMKVAEEFQKVQKDVNQLKGLLNGIFTAPIPEPGNGAPSAFQTAMRSALSGWISSNLSLTTKNNIENTKIKH